MTPAAVNLVLELLAARSGDVERTARHMRDALRLGTVAQCRHLIAEARWFGPCSYCGALRDEPCSADCSSHQHTFDEVQS